MSGKGQELFDAAEKKLKKWFSFGGNKYEEAAELFGKSGNQFKVAKEWKSAGTSFMRCSDCRHHCGDQYECVEALVEAARCFKKVKCEDAETCYKAASDMHCDDGRFSSAAKLQKELGEYYKECEKFDQAIEALKKAVDYYKGEEQTTSANTVLLDIGKIYAEELSMPEEAIRAYETVMKSYLAGNQKYQVKDIILKCMMCRFLTIKPNNVAEQAQHCKEAFARYEDMDINLQNTREQELLEGLVHGAIEQDGKLISKAAARYEEIKKLDEFQVHCLLTLKKTVEEDDAGQFM